MQKGVAFYSQTQYRSRICPTKKTEENSSKVYHWSEDVKKYNFISGNNFQFEVLPIWQDRAIKRKFCLWKMLWSVKNWFSWFHCIHAFCSYFYLKKHLTSIYVFASCCSSIAFISLKQLKQLWLSLAIIAPFSINHYIDKN